MTIATKLKATKEKLSSTGAGLLKVSLAELAILNKNTNLLDKLAKLDNTNAKTLLSTFKRYFSGEVIDNTEAKTLSQNISTFLSDITKNGDVTNSKLEQLNLRMLTLINQSSDADTNEKILLKSMENIDSQLENNKLSQDLFNRTLEGLFAKKMFNSNMNSNEQSSKSSGGSLLPGIGVLGAGIVGLKVVLGKYLKNKAKDFVKDKAMDFVKSKIPSSVTGFGKAATNLNFVDKASKFSKISGVFKGFGMGILKKAGPIGLALTIGDVLKNTYSEFFGDESNTTTMYEKVRNVFTKTLSDFFGGLIDHKTINKAIDYISDMVINIGTTIGSTIGSITTSIYNGLKSMLPAFMQQYLPEVGQTKEIAGPPSPPSRTASTENYEATQSTFSKLYNNPTGFIKEGVAGISNYMAGGSITGGVDGNPEVYIPDPKATATANSMADNVTKNKLTKFRGRCYEFVGRAMDEANTGINVNADGKNRRQSAFQFSDYAENTAHGKSKLTRVMPSSMTDMQVGDIIVYGSRQSSSGGYDGHIEILNKNGDAISDSTDPGASQLKGSFKNGKIAKGQVKIFRLKGASSKVDQKPLGISKGQDFSQGASAQSSQVTSSSKENSMSTKSSNFKTAAFKAISKNETSDPYKVSHAMLGTSNLTIGKSQFDVGSRSDVWEKVGFKKDEIERLKTIGNTARKAGSMSKISNQDKEFISYAQNKINSNKSVIDEADKQQHTALYDYVNRADETLFKPSGLDISDPTVKAQLMDISNQFTTPGSKGMFFDNKTVEKLRNFSGGNKVTNEGIKQWRLSTLYAKTKSGANDMIRRQNNITSAFSNTNEEYSDSNIFEKPSQTVSSIDNEIVKPTKIQPVKSIGKSQLNTAISKPAKKEEAEKAKDVTTNMLSSIPKFQMNRVANSSSKGSSTNKTTSVGNDDLLILNFGYIR